MLTGMGLIQDMLARMIGNQGFKESCDLVYEPGTEMVPGSNCPLIYCSFKHIRSFWVDRREIKGEYRLLTHGGDKHLDESMFNAFNDDRLVSWHSINVLHKHEKIKAIPIGFADEHIRSAPGFEDLKKHRRLGGDRNNKILVNFRTETNPNERSKYYDLDLDPEVFTVMAPDAYGDNDRYLEEVSKHSFVLCPAGKSIDTFRFWESLFLGAIPIVTNGYHHYFFKDAKCVWCVNLEYSTIINGFGSVGFEIGEEIFQTSRYLS